MGPNGYRLLGFVVWRGARWYLRRRLDRLVEPRRLAAAGAVAVAVAGIAAAGVAARGQSSAA